MWSPPVAEEGGGCSSVFSYSGAVVTDADGFEFVFPGESVVTGMCCQRLSAYIYPNLFAVANNNCGTCVGKCSTMYDLYLPVLLLFATDLLHR